MLRPLKPQSLVRKFAALAILASASVFSAPAFAQPMMPAGGPEGPNPLAPNDVLNTVGVDQKLDAQVSPDLTFKDEAGKTVRLGDYFGKKPLVLSLVYYECPGLCTMTLNGVARSLKPIEFNAGKEFDILTISFDPRETPELAAAKKSTYLKEYLSSPIVKHDAASAQAGWHFLTGDDANIKQLCETVGFRYRYDEKTKQFAHGSAIMVLTPQGRVSRYFYGLEYSSKDIRLGLIEASDNKIGTVTDAVVLLCYMYDPASGKYSLAILSVMRIGAVLTVLSIGGFVGLMLFRERRTKLRAMAEGNPSPEILNPQ
jgi:protein SCO1/2